MASPTTEPYDAASPSAADGTAPPGREATRDELLATMAQMAERIQMLEAAQSVPAVTTNGEDQDTGLRRGPLFTPPHTPAPTHQDHRREPQSSSPFAAASNDRWSESSSQWQQQYWESHSQAPSQRSSQWDSQWGSQWSSQWRGGDEDGDGDRGRTSWDDCLRWLHEDTIGDDEDYQEGCEEDWEWNEVWEEEGEGQ